MYLQELNATLLENQEYIRDEVLHALKRIDEGTYGNCENCGRPIIEERLELLPYTRYCTACAEALQAGKEVNLNEGRPRSGADTLDPSDDEVGRRPLGADVVARLLQPATTKSLRLTSSSIPLNGLAGLISTPRARREEARPSAAWRGPISAKETRTKRTWKRPREAANLTSRSKARMTTPPRIPAQPAAPWAARRPTGVPSAAKSPGEHGINPKPEPGDSPTGP